MWSSLSLSLLKAEQAEFPQPVLREMLQSKINYLEIIIASLLQIGKILSELYLRIFFLTEHPTHEIYSDEAVLTKK